MVTDTIQTYTLIYGRIDNNVMNELTEKLKEIKEKQKEIALLANEAGEILIRSKIPTKRYTMKLEDVPECWRNVN